MKHFLLVLLLSGQTGTLAMVRQVQAPTPKTTAPAARTLTPSEQRQKEKIDREVQRDRQIRAEWAQKQREYEARQAEKERERQAKKAEKAGSTPQQSPTSRAAVTPKPSIAPSPANAPTVTSAPPAEAVPTVVEPSRKEKREKRKQEEAAAAAAAPKPVDTPQPTVTTGAPPAESSRKERREKRKQEAEAANPKPVDAPQPTVTTTVPATEVAEPAKPVEKPRRSKPTPPAEPTTTAAPTTPERSRTEPSSVGPSVSRPTSEFLPKGHLFAPILLDPLEAQTYGSFLPSYTTEGKKYPGSIVPFAFGFAKPFYRRTTASGNQSEWVLDLASFTQFELFYDYALDKARRQIMNNDYKISILYNLRQGVNNYRFRVYHLSSHLADDYIYRNKITAPTPNSVNYEVVDATYSRNVRDWRLYGGIGIGLRNSAERKRFSAQIGAYYKKPSEHAARLVGGVDIKFWQQTDFRPGIHGGIGIELGKTDNNLTFLLEGYSGFRPYSQFESQKTSWIGFGMYLNPF